MSGLFGFILEAVSVLLFSGGATLAIDCGPAAATGTSTGGASEAAGVVGTGGRSCAKQPVKSISIKMLTERMCGLKKQIIKVVDD